MIIHPAPNYWVEQTNQAALFHRFVIFDDLPGFLKKSESVPLRWFDEEFTVVLSDGFAKKIKAFLDVRNLGFLRGEHQASCSQELLYKRFNLVFKKLFRAPGYHEVIGISDQMTMGLK